MFPTPGTRIGPKRSRIVQLATTQTFNFKAANNSGAPNTKIDIGPGPFATFWEAVLENSTTPLPATLKVTLTQTFTINMGVVGINGLDTGTQQASTWYYFWLISDGSTVAGLLSASSTVPVLPSGYTYKALLGAVRSDGSTHFQTFVQLGKVVGVAQTNVFSGAASQSSYTSQSLASIVPPIASCVSGLFSSPTTSAGNDVWSMSVAGDANGLGENFWVIRPVNFTVLYGQAVGSSYLVPLKTPQTIFWKSSQTNNATYTLYVTGWGYP